MTLEEIKQHKRTLYRGPLILSIVFSLVTFLVVCYWPWSYSSIHQVKLAGLLTMIAAPLSFTLILWVSIDGFNNMVHQYNSEARPIEKLILSVSMHKLSEVMVTYEEDGQIVTSNFSIDQVLINGLDHLPATMKYIPKYNKGHNDIVKTRVEVIMPKKLLVEAIST